MSLDAVRVFAMLAIVAGHIWVDGPARPFLYSWHVPIFFLLSGYLWKVGRSFNREVRNRVRSLLIPYAVWLVLLGTVTLGTESVEGGFDPIRLAHLLWGGQFATGGPFWAMWFVTALFFAAVIYWPVSRLPLPGQWAIAAILFIAAAYIPGHPARFLPLSLGLALACIIFIVAGRSMRRARGMVRHPIVTGVVLLAVSFTLIVLGWSQPLDLKRLDVGTPVVSIVVAVALSFGFILITEGLLGGDSVGEDAKPSVRRKSRVDGIGQLSRVVTQLAQASLTVLFIHPAVITGLHSSGLPKPVVYLLTIGIAWPVGLLLLRLPHSRAVTGLKPAH